MVFENGVKNMQAAAYNGVRTVNSSGAAQNSFGLLDEIWQFLSQ